LQIIISIYSFEEPFSAQFSQNATMSKIEVRKSENRGHADHGWLNTYHTFNFADYHDPKFESFGCLRVINEDRVLAGKGFGTHSHREFDIFSYVISGELEHKDSMGNLETIHRGEVQFTCAGTGISHSEFNRNPTQTVHFLQIWVSPATHGLKPYYKTMNFTDEQKKGKLVKIVSGSDSSVIKVNNDIDVYATLIDKGVEVTHTFASEKRRGYIHVSMTGGSVSVNGDTLLKEGDGAFIENTKNVSIKGVGDTTAEVVFFDLE